MANNSSNFFYPHSRYYGDINPENLILNANLQEFAQRVSLISCLATGGKLSPEEAFDAVEILWERLEAIKDQLEVT